MLPHTVHLPDGQTFTVTPAFAGVFFKSHELSTHPHAFPIGWTVVLHTEEGGDSRSDAPGSAPGDAPSDATDAPASDAPRTRAFTQPTLQGDHLFISSVSNPSSLDFKPAASPSRQIAMMLWVTLYWYFHQPAPPVTLSTAASAATPLEGRPRGQWRVHVDRDGVLRGRNLLPKLERMGLIASLDTTVDTATDSSVLGSSLFSRDDEHAWPRMFVSQRAFWQLPARLFLFTLQPAAGSRGTPSQPGSPTGSRPGSPGFFHRKQDGNHTDSRPGSPPTLGAVSSVPPLPIGPFSSSSHLPTYYPPPPLQHTTTDGVRHPLRPRPPHMGEVLYARFVPSVGQYLAFRVASLSSRPVPYAGPVGPHPPPAQHAAHLGLVSDTALLQMWLGVPRVQAFWGGYEPGFLSRALASSHSFPVIGLWDGVPFGYFEIYWVKEDPLGRIAGGGAVDDWDRGIHVLVGEEWARGRVPFWLSSLVHWALSADYRTMGVCVEPRVDNARFIKHLQDGGFSKQSEVSFPHKQAWFGRLRRDAWEGPAL